MRTSARTDRDWQQAERDLVNFLALRARELAPGGKLLIASPGDAPDQRICDGLYDVLNDACLDLVASGRVARAFMVPPWLGRARPPGGAAGV